MQNKDQQDHVKSMNRERHVKAMETDFFLAIQKWLEKKVLAEVRDHLIPIVDLDVDTDEDGRSFAYSGSVEPYDLAEVVANCLVQHCSPELLAAIMAEINQWKSQQKEEK